jgi:hypothetical protein
VLTTAQKIEIIGKRGVYTAMHSNEKHDTKSKLDAKERAG